MADARIIINLAIMSILICLIVLPFTGFADHKSTNYSAMSKLQVGKYAEYDGIVVAYTSDKSYLHVLVVDGSNYVLPVWLNEPADVEVGDYVHVSGYHIYTFTLWEDPITHAVYGLSNVLRRASLEKLGEGVSVEVDGGCGYAFCIGEEVTIKYSTIVESYYAELVVVTPRGAVLLYGGALSPGTYTIKGKIGEPEGSRTVIFRVNVRQSMDIVGYGESVEIEVTCTYTGSLCADLSLENVAVGELHECGSGSVEIVVANRGVAASQQTSLTVYLGGEVLGSTTIPPLRPGESRVFVVEVNVPCCAPASDLTIKVDSENLVVESNEDNNVYRVPRAVRVLEPSIDLALKQVEVSGREAKLYILITNEGEVEVRDIDVEVSASRGLKVLEIPRIASLPPGSSETVTVRLSGERGTYSIMFTLTYSDACGREWSTTKAFEVALKTELPVELTVTPSTIEALQEVTVSGRVPPEAAGITVIGVYRYEGGEWSEATSVKVGADGSFSYVFTPERAGTYQVGIYFPGNENWKETLAYAELVVVKIKSSVTLNLPEKATVGVPADISGYLSPPREAEGWLILMSPGGEEERVPVKASPSGAFHRKVIFNESGEWRVKIVFPGDDTYEGAESTSPISILLLRAPVPLSLAIASITVGTALGVVSMLDTPRRVISSFVRKIENLLERLRLKPPKWLEELANFYSEEVFKSLTEREAPPPAKWRLLTPKEISAIVISAAIVFLVLAYVETHGDIAAITLSLDLAFSILVVAVVIAVIDGLSESVLSKLRGYWAEYSLWPHGAVSMVISGLLFFSPFASPSRTLYSRGYPEREKALVAALKSVIFMLLACAFILIRVIGLEVISDSGLLVTLTLLFYSLFPVKPLPGYELLVVSKPLWCVLFLSSGALYVLHITRMLPMEVYIAACSVSLLLSLLATFTIARRPLRASRE